MAQSVETDARSGPAENQDERMMACCVFVECSVDAFSRRPNRAIIADCPTAVLLYRPRKQRKPRLTGRIKDRESACFLHGELPLASRERRRDEKGAEAQDYGVGLKL